MMNELVAPGCLVVALARAADYPSAEISNGQVRSETYLPHVKLGIPGCQWAEDTRSKDPRWN